MSSTYDFDFLVGHWAVANRRRGAGGVWHEFAGTSTVANHVDNRVQLDHYDVPDFPGRGHVKALTVRSFDEVERQWSLVWLANYSTPDPRPVVGAWEGDRGAFFFTDETAAGPVELRFDWLRDAGSGPRWSQSLRRPGGDWELDWTMDFTRAR